MGSGGDSDGLKRDTINTGVDPPFFGRIMKILSHGITSTDVGVMRV